MFDIRNVRNQVAAVTAQFIKLFLEYAKDVRKFKETP